MIPLINGIAEAWFRYMASATLQATLLALFILGILRIGRRWSPALRYAFMMLALCKFVVPPMLSLPTGLLNRIQSQQWAESVPLPRYVAPAAQSILSSVGNAQPGGIQPLPARSLPKPYLTTNGKLLLLHFAGASLILAAAAVQKLRLRRLASRATAAQDPALAETYNVLCQDMKLFRKPRLLISRDNRAPITYGAWKPVVMLPHALVASLPLFEIRVILGHELAHHRRRDPWVAWLQVIISAIWWFNPVYWLLSRSIRSVREDCCDDMVLASGVASREVYCRTLLKAAWAALENKAITRAAFAYLGKSQPLRRRFRRIMGIKFIHAPKLAMAGMLMIFALGLVLLPGIEPRILAQNPLRAESLTWSINPVPQETAAVLQNPDKASKPESRSPDKNRDNNHTPIGKESKSETGETQARGSFTVAQFYDDRGNYAGARTRLKEIIDNYPGFSRIDEVNRLYAALSTAQQRPISEYYRKWLEEDVVYIITPEEKNGFLALKTDEERGFFIEQFWARRDLDPRSGSGVFKKEHYRHIAYANEHFASSLAGWKTDRGRIYIMWGKPDEIESHPGGGPYNRLSDESGGTTDTYPFEKWWYRHIDGVGDNIQIEFVDLSGTGEYRLAMSPDEKVMPK
jgi:GWxTD domain-containing protein